MGPNSDLERKVDWLFARARIIDVVNRFAVALDTRDWDLHATCFAETVTFDYPVSGGFRVVKAAELRLGSGPFFAFFDATQHLAASHHVEIDGDRAVCLSSLHAQHFRAGHSGGDLQKQVGFYRNQLMRIEDDWKIFHSKQIVRWSEGNQLLFNDALEHRRVELEQAGHAASTKGFRQ